MVSGLLTPHHWMSRRFSRHWNAIDVSLHSVKSSVNKRFFIGSALEHIEAPSPAITHRAAEARKTLDDLFAFEAELSESLRAINESSASVDIELLCDLVSQLQTSSGKVKSLGKLYTVWEQSAGLFLVGEDKYSEGLSVYQNEIALKAKNFFLATICINMLQFLLQYLLQFSFKNGNYLRYWEERELEYKNWYWIETTPWFWGLYLLQKYDLSPSFSSPSPSSGATPPLLHPKRAMRAKLKTLRELRHQIAESIGRLTVQLNAFRKLQTVEETQPLMSQLIAECFVVLQLFDPIANYNNNNSATESAAEGQHPESAPSSEQFAQTYNQIGRCITSFKDVFICTSERLKASGIPNWYSTHWMHIGAGAVVMYFVTKSLYTSRHSIVQYVKDTSDAAVRFWKDHLEVPLKNIWEAVRYDKTTLSVADKVSLKQDLDSLGRMVADFAKDNNASLSDTELTALMQAAQEGDLSQVLLAYEQNIKSPIRNVVFGDLIRLVLIQVQKQKVDLEKAMEALDQLLRANELNFQFLATIPAVLLIGGIVYQFQHLFRSKTPNRALYASIHTDMRNLERMLNTKASVPDQDVPVAITGKIGGLSYEAYGLLLHITTKLQFMADRLLSGRNRGWFEEDLKEIESEKTGTTQKLATIQRMYHTHAFLQKQ